MDPFGEILEDVIDSWKLVDVKQRKGKYTWNNKRFGPRHIAARLDHILVSLAMLDKPLLPITRLLTSTVFDHKPLIFSLDPIGNLGPQPFKFSPLWLTEIRFLDVISQEFGRNIGINRKGRSHQINDIKRKII